jgi:rfaE bifunctional protein nucleotidyltransferase chain/domain
MRSPQVIADKIYDLPSLRQQVVRLRLLKKTISFTNGCFDILHRGHISSLSEAAGAADFLIVGVNSDESVKRLKGKGRPVSDQESRLFLLASLMIVDAVILFGEDTPRDLIAEILPDVLVKGGDYEIHQVAGSAEVLAAGGKVLITPLLPGFSTSELISKIHNL